MMKTSEEGRALIKKFEGCELEAYQCSANVWTIGYGHTQGVKEGDVCTQEDADRMLEEDLEEFEGYVQEAVNVPLEQHEFDALVAWTYNLGPSNLRSSTMLKRLNDSKFDQVPSEMRRWNKAGGKVLDGLVRRREAESLLFTNEDWGHV
jgi:lysozyme